MVIEPILVFLCHHMAQQFKGSYNRLLSPMVKNGIHPQGHDYDDSSEHTILSSLLRKVIELQAQYMRLGL
jgi:hypothetical protein